MGILGLTAPIWIGASALLLFCALLIVRSTFSLVRSVKTLSTRAKAANTQIQGSVDEVRELGARATATKAGIARRRSGA